ncbi:MAG: hypothetical protein ACI9TH_004720 [Kiritimatiellia bacterium]
MVAIDATWDNKGKEPISIKPDEARIEI